MTDVQVVTDGRRPRPGRRRHSQLRWTAVEALAFLLVGAFAVLTVALQPDPRVRPAREAVERYLDTLMIPDFPAAYAQLCWAVRHNLSEQGFTDKSYKISRYRILKVRATDGAHADPVSATIAVTPSWGSQPRTGVLGVVEDQSAWRVCPT